MLFPSKAMRLGPQGPTLLITKGKSVKRERTSGLLALKGQELISLSTKTSTSTYAKCQVVSLLINVHPYFLGFQNSSSNQ